MGTVFYLQDVNKAVPLFSETESLKDMKFTKYIWDLYRNSIEGKNDIELFQNIDIVRLSEQFRFCIKGDYYDENQKLQSFDPFYESLDDLKTVNINSFKQAREFFSKWVIREVQNERYNNFIYFLSTYSTALFQRFPDYFIPFYFDSEDYTDFTSICDNLDIVLPPVPARNDWVKRTWYYFEICETLHKFRKKHAIDSKEFPALLYFFGLNCLEKIKEEDLPKPSKIYLLGAGAAGSQKDEVNEDFHFLDNANNDSTEVWGAGNLNIKKGDLVLVYCVSPRKYLHSIWRALENSFINPFGYHYYLIKIGFPQRIKPVGFQELLQNRIFKENPTVKAHMQGMNGRSLFVKEYAELLQMIESKGQNTDTLPKLPVYQRNVGNIENERDVEQQLIEPLLNDLGFLKNDWIRQLPLRMGRQTKYYPDYAIKANATRGREKAKVVLEAKYSINSDTQLCEAFDQARSYALRLQSEKIVIADRDFVWVYAKIRGDFDSTPILRLHWNELNDTDNLHKLKENLK